MNAIAVSTICVLSLALTGPAMANATLNSEAPTVSNPQVDYAGFAKLTHELQDYRQARLVSLDQFTALARSKDAIILDTRSAAAFQFGHIEGAINLPFSDFTEDKLAKILGDQKRPILIYCNNNFRDNIMPVRRKSAPLALNIPTFINLYGYGYRNIYELNDVVMMSDPRINWVPFKFDS